MPSDSHRPSEQAARKGHFPFGADPKTHLSRVPYAQTLGFEWLKGSDDGVELHMPADAANLDSQGALHQLALLAFLDHACSAAVYQALPEPNHIATIDLRCEFAALPFQGAGVDCHARTVHLDDGFAIVRASITCSQTKRSLAFASSAYALGAHPGMQNKVRAAEPYRPASPPPQHPHADFEQMLGLREIGPAWELPFEERLIGGLSLPSMHGGAIGAGLVTAALGLARRELDGGMQWRPLTVGIQYLRAVESRPTRIEAAVRKRGRRSCVISSSGSQVAGKESAYAECLLVVATKD